MLLRNLLLLGLLATGIGCAAVEDQRYRNVNRLRASSAWRDARDCVPESLQTRDYARGWKDGYFDVATGGCGDQPAVAPSCYWSAKYQCAEGRCKIDQYFAGWQAGAICADKQGRNLWHNVPLRHGVCPLECPTDCGNGDSCWISETDNGMVTR